MAEDPRLLLMAQDDNVLVARMSISAGTQVSIDGAPASIAQGIAMGHKIARHDIERGEIVLKYGAPIGKATAPIARGAHVHVHNLTSDYTPTYALSETQEG